MSGSPTDDRGTRRPREITRAGFLRAATATAVVGLLEPGLATGATRAVVAHPQQPAEHGWKRLTPQLVTRWSAQVSPDNAHPEYPRPQLTRPRWVSLNGVWQFAAAGPNSTPPIGQELGERILVPYPVESALSGIMRHEERMFYRRRFRVPEEWQVDNGRSPQRLMLHLDAVDWEATVWVNGLRLGAHRGGYDRFSLDVTDALRRDRDGVPRGDQELIVGAFDPTEDGVQPLGKQRVAAILPPDAPGGETLYYTPSSGIWQSVWLEPVPERHVRSLTAVADLEAGCLRLTVHAGGVGARAVRATASSRGRTVATATGQAGHELRLGIESPRLWSPEDPFLYDLSVELLDGPDADRVESYFAMRSIDVRSVDGIPRIALNGRPYVSLSTLHQGFWPDGIYTPATDQAARFDIARNKALGFNTIRKHQKLESDRWYHHAARLGQLVWQDMPATATGAQPPHLTVPPPPPPTSGQRQFRLELRRIIAQHISQPAIVMWIPFNEGWGAFDVAAIARAVKRLDPSRLVNEMSGANTAGYDAGGGDVLDNHNIGFNPPAPVPSTASGRAAVIGEFGAYGLVIPGHLWDPASTSSPAPVPDAATLDTDYVAIMRSIADYVATQGLSAANYNLNEDAEHQVNGLHTYDRAVFKADPASVLSANRAVIEAGPSAPTIAPTTERRRSA